MEEGECLAQREHKGSLELRMAQLWPGRNLNRERLRLKTVGRGGRNMLDHLENDTVRCLHSSDKEFRGESGTSHIEN